MLNIPEEYQAYGEDFNKRLQNLQEMDQPTIQDLEGIEDQFNSEKAEQLLADNSDKLTEAKEVMQKLKKKYTSVPNSNDLKDAVKRNSLEEKKFIERLSFGGNFQITSTDPVIIDASPTEAYGISKIFQVGLGIS
ncbi:MAG: hypothetical protein AAF363_00145 [Bacteroidota bacterium]